MTPLDALRERLEERCERVEGTEDLCYMLAEEALRWVEEQAPGADEIDEVIKRGLTGACAHGKKKLGPCRPCAVSRCRMALLALLRERLGAGKGEGD